MHTITSSIFLGRIPTFEFLFPLLPTIFVISYLITNLPTYSSWIAALLAQAEKRIVAESTYCERNSVRERDQTCCLFRRSFIPSEGFQLPAICTARECNAIMQNLAWISMARMDRQPCKSNARILLVSVRWLLPAPREITSMTVRQRIVSSERSMITLWAVVATGTADTLGSSDGLLCWVQQTIQHLADRAVFAVERIGVHGRSPSAKAGSLPPFSHTRKSSLERIAANSSNRRPLALGGTICTLFTW